MKTKAFHAAVYLRLSREDGDVVDGGKQVSNSIANQKELITDFLKSHLEITVIDTYIDDGYSGVNFDRPEFQRMLTDIREQRINTVIVKDLSRFGRNYIESGRYIEKIFPMLGIRFIAITDNYDSVNDQAGTDLIVPFKNLINDAYCRDISIKVRSHMDIKRRNGDYIGAFAAYGYQKDSENKNHLVIDEYAAEVVRDIFSMKICGMSNQTIADKLNAAGIPSPLQHKKNLHTTFQKTINPKWSYNAVLRVLENEVYTGTVVQGKYTTPNYKIKKRICRDSADWIRVEDKHEAIIPRSDFDLVQKLLMMDTRKSPDRAEVFPLAGMVFCADCGSPMVRKTVPSKGRKYVYYVCSGNMRDKHTCSAHSIPENRLTVSVLRLVQNHICSALSSASAVEMMQNSNVTTPAAQRLENRLQKLRDERDTCSKRKKNLYESYTDGVLSRSEYESLKEQYQNQLTEIESGIETVTAERDRILENGTHKQEWIEKLKKYKDTTTLDRELATFILEKIEVADSHTLAATYRFGTVLKEMESAIDLYSKEIKEVI